MQELQPELIKILLPLPSAVQAKKTKGFSLAIDTNIYYIEMYLHIFGKKIYILLYGMVKGKVHNSRKADFFIQETVKIKLFNI